MNLLKIDNVIKNFGKTKVLKGIDLTVAEGEIISVLGPSGCGKSTLLRIIAGILPLDGGSVCIRDTVVSSAKNNVATEKRDINMVFQDFALWPHMKVCDNITYGLKIKKLPKNEIATRLAEVVALLHLEGLIDRYPSELSGGQQQRVAIARALITKPSIVLLDEPLCNLDIQLRVEMRTEMAYLFKKIGTTVFHVTHDPSEAFAMADRIIIMNAGVIDQIDTPMACYQQPKTAIVAGLLGASNQLHKGTLIAQANGMAQVALGSETVQGKAFFTNNNTGTSIVIRFRPENATFATQPTSNSIPVHVVVSTFEGSCYRIKAETALGEAISFLHHEKLPSGTNGFLNIASETLYIYSA